MKYIVGGMKNEQILEHERADLKQKQQQHTYAQNMYVL